VRLGRRRGDAPNDPVLEPLDHCTVTARRRDSSLTDSSVSTSGSEAGSNRASMTRSRVRTIQPIRLARVVRELIGL
jgi:hypothetical protein